MKKGRKIAGTAADSTLPKTPVVIDGKTYNLCFDMGALSEAEAAINVELARAGSDQRINLLAAMVEQNLMNARILFAAALRVFHPEISYEQALGMVRGPALFDIALAEREAYGAAMPEPGAGPSLARGVTTAK